MRGGEYMSETPQENQEAGQEAQPATDDQEAQGGGSDAAQEGGDSPQDAPQDAEQSQS